MKTGSNRKEIEVFYKKKTAVSFDIKKNVKKIIRSEKIPGDISINIIFVSDSFIRKLNKDFRKKDKPTDVLTFEFNAKECGFRGGDIYISVDRARADAKKDGITLKHEFAKLIVHGVLHAIGYDHIKDKDYKKMSNKEIKYLEYFIG